MDDRPLAIDLFTGLHGWSEGLVAEGFRVIGFDIEDMCGQFGQPRPEHVQLVIQDVLTIHGAQFRKADLIVARPPCQFFSYTAMPWSRAKALAAEVRADPERLAKELALFNACFRIQREACAAAGRHIPLVVENVRGAIPWVGRSRWNFGSFHLWGDVPVLMPVTLGRNALKAGIAHRPGGATNFHRESGNGAKVPGFRFDGSGRSFQTASVDETGVKQGGNWFHDSAPGTLRSYTGSTGRKQPGISGPRQNGKGDAWFQDGAARHGSKSPARKAASAMIAKIPLALSRHIAATYFPAGQAQYGAAG